MLNSVLTTSPQTLGQMADEFRLNVRKWFKFFFTEKNISYPWTGRLLFWRCLLKMFDDGSLFFQHIVRKWRENHNYFSNFFPEIVPVDRWNAISTIVTKLSCEKAGKCSLIVRKWYEILIPSKQQIFPRHVPRHT